MDRRSGRWFWLSTPPPYLHASQASFIRCRSADHWPYTRSISPLGCPDVGYMGERIVDYVKSRRDFDRIEWVRKSNITRAVVNDDPVVTEIRLLTCLIY